MDFEKQVLNKVHQKPEWQLGFGAMRRVEIIRYAQQYRHKIGWKDEFEAISKDALVKMMDGYLAQGIIPHPYQPEEHPAVVEARQATAKVADLEKQVQELLSRVNAQGDRKILPVSENVVDAPEKMSWPGLKKYARQKGVEVRGKKRPEILEALKGL